ncbi:IclR family transcriptional regulator [Gulosibacter sp. 10]|uniref:IclR family transcriptional regulator n=1 Tax=Gulosibacter sp. 10 TaxID=1255570 RepID=UPI0015959A27|nr:IclR family transcriptional regulator [Gulosibacter sp. 10]
MPFIPPDDRKRAATTLQTVERALSFLEIVSERPIGATVRDIAGELGINLTTCYHLYNTLLARGYVERNADGTIRLGTNVASLYEGYRNSFAYQREMLAIVRRLSETTGETTFFSHLVNDAVILTALYEGTDPVKAGSLYVGLSGLEHVRASGKAVLAFSDPETRERVLERSLSAVPPAQRLAIATRLEEEVREIVARGWSIDDEGYENGIIGVGAPCFALDGRCVGAVGVWASASEWPARREEISSAALASAVEASRVLADGEGQTSAASESGV